MTSTAGLPAPAASRTDPRLLAAGTTQRFVLLLILMAVGGIQLVSGVLSAPDYPGYAGPHDNSIQCMLAAGLNPAAILESAAALRNSAAYSACTARYSWNPAWWWPLVVMGAAAAAGAALYVWLATGRRRVVPAADLDVDGSLTALFGELADTAGLHRTPGLVIDPTAATMSAVAYGLPRHHTVCLHGGLVTRMRSDPEGFRAVVLHELAHIRNRDIGITYATVAAWRVYLVVLLFPASLSAAWSLLSPFTAAYSTLESAYLSLQLHALAAAAFMVLLVFLSRADLLRTRETYADLDAAHWGAAPRAWPGDNPRQGWAAGFLRLWQSHPDWRQRAAALTDTSGLFRVSSIQMFLTGGAAGLLLYRLQDDLGLVTGSGGDSLTQTPEWVVYASAALAAALIAAIAGVQLWRAAAHASQLGLTASSGFRPGLWLAVGLAAGDVLTGSVALGLEWLPLQPAWLIVLVFLVLVGAMWTADLAGLAIGARGVARARAVMAACLGITWLTYTLWLIWWVMVGDLFATGLSVASAARALPLLPTGTPEFGHEGILTAYNRAIVLVSTDIQWLLVILTLPLWAVPLAFLVVPRTAQMTQRHGPPRLRVIVLTGLGGGVACWALAAGAMAYIHTWPPVSQEGQVVTLVFFGYLTLSVAAGMAASAAVSAAVTRVHALTAAMISAGVASLVGLVGVYALAGSNGCISPLTVGPTSCAWRATAAWAGVSDLPGLDWTLGTALALGVGLIALGAAALVRAVRSTLGQEGQPASARRTAGVAPGRRDQRRRLVASVASVLVLTVGATTLLVASVAANGGGGEFLSSFDNAATPAQQQDAVLPEPGRPSAVVIRIQAIAWLAVGGSHLSGELYASIDDLQRAKATAAKKLDGHTVSRQGLDSALAPVGAACAHLAAVDRRLEAFFPMPDAALNSPWQKELSEIRIGTAACEEGVVRSRSATPATINNILGHYFGILNDSITKAEQLIPASTGIVALAKGH